MLLLVLLNKEIYILTINAKDNPTEKVFQSDMTLMVWTLEYHPKTSIKALAIFFRSLSGL